MSDRLFFSTRKGLFTVEPKAGRWQVTNSAFLGDNVTLSLYDRRDGAAYAALNHGHFGVKLHRSDDGGVNWQPIAAPAYPEPPADAPPDMCPMRKTPIPWSTQLVWELTTGGTDQPGTLWAGTAPGGVFRSDDRGDSWSLNRPLWDDPRRKLWFGGGLDWAGAHSICVDPRDSNNVAVGVSCGGVWHTNDGGTTWTCDGEGMRNAYMPPGQEYEPVAQDPHRMVQCPSHPDVLWVQHHNGIFRSDDRGKKWNEVVNENPSSFGFAVAVHPQDPKTAWFVPAQKDERRIPVDGALVVCRTRDGGSTFETLTAGLPSRHAYDIVYRHALDVSRDGQRLAFGSTTGAAWVSENGGDSWQLVNAHLPPIHAVTFAG